MSLLFVPGHFCFGAKGFVQMFLVLTFFLEQSSLKFEPFPLWRALFAPDRFCFGAEGFVQIFLVLTEI